MWLYARSCLCVFQLACWGLSVCACVCLPVRVCQAAAKRVIWKTTTRARDESPDRHAAIPRPAVLSSVCGPAQPEFLLRS
eukprot:6205982-Pleurochrysis_carterae.AAC.4